MLREPQIDFMIAEYNNIAHAHFKAGESFDNLLKWCFSILAAPGALLAIFYGNGSEGFNLLKLHPNHAFMFLAVGTLNLLMMVALIHQHYDKILYARTVNGVRKFFDDTAEHKLSQYKYLVLPIKTDTPSYYKLGSASFMIVVFMALADSAYLFLGLNSLFQINIHTTLLIAVVFGYFHVAIYRYTSLIKETFHTGVKVRLPWIISPYNIIGSLFSFLLTCFIPFKKMLKIITGNEKTVGL